MSPVVPPSGQLPEWCIDALAATLAVARDDVEGQRILLRPYETGEQPTIGLINGLMSLAWNLAVQVGQERGGTPPEDVLQELLTRLREEGF